MIHMESMCMCCISTIQVIVLSGQLRDFDQAHQAKQLRINWQAFHPSNKVQLAVYLQYLMGLEISMHGFVYTCIMLFKYEPCKDATAID